MTSNYHPIEGDLFTAFTALKKEGYYSRHPRQVKKRGLLLDNIKHIKKGTPFLPPFTTSMTKLVHTLYTPIRDYPLS